MSYLNGPRINFWGGGSTNVDTANNEQYDEDRQQPIVDLINTTVTESMTDEQVIDFLRSPATAKGNPYFVKGGWNFYGDHQFAFMQNKVSSAGLPGAVSTEGSLIDLPVYLLGSLDPISGDGPYGGPVMVDLDPTSSVTTQIYAGGLMVGNPDKPALLIQGRAVCHSRMLGLRYLGIKGPYATPGSISANGTFQLAFNRADIVSYDATNPILRQILDNPRTQGIMVRFSMFQFFPGKDTATIQKNYAENRNDANPSLGRIIGSIGAWYEDELATELNGRHLENKQLPGAQGVASYNPVLQMLSMDLISALPGSAIRKNGTDNTLPPEPNIDYGNIHIAAGATQVASVASLPDDYYVYGGIYDVAVGAAASELIQNNPLTLTSDTGNLLIQEQPVRITSDQRNVYCDPAAETIRVRLGVRYLGGPVTQPTILTLSNAAPGSLPDGNFLQYPPVVTVPAGKNYVEFTIQTDASKDGFSQLNIAANCSAGSFISFRKYPLHDFSAVIQSGDIPWSLVYQECLRFYYVLFPAMSKRIPLNDEATIQAVGGELLKRLSDAYRDTTLYMPLTRSMSPGKVALLRAFIEKDQAS